MRLAQLFSVFALAVLPSSAEYVTLDFSRNLDTSGIFSGFVKPIDGNVTLDSIPYYLGIGTEDAWNAHEAVGSNPRTLTVQANQSGVLSVYILINTYWGETSPGTYASVSFHRQGSATPYTLELDGNVHMRDFNPNVWTNNLDPNWAKPVWTNGGLRMDRLQVDLPTEFAGDTLTNITFADNGGTNLQRIFVSGVTLETGSAVPEPATYAMLGVGLATLGLLRRRQKW